MTDAISWSATAFWLGSRGQTEAAEALEARLLQRLEAAERFVINKPFMAEDSFSLADIAGFTIIFHYRDRLDWRPDRPLVQWFDRVGTRPRVQRGLSIFQNS